MQLRRSWLLICAESTLLAYASAAGAISLVPLEEPMTQLAPPTGVSPMQYAQVGSIYVSQPVTSTPLLCGNTSAPASNFSAISPLYYSPTGTANLKPFVMGASSTNPNASAPALGAAMNYLPSSVQLAGDPALVCYGLDANGVHGPTPGVLRDQFEGLNFSPTLKSSFNSSVLLTVFHLPASSTDFFGYTVDVTIPAKPASVTCGPTATDCNFALLEGFDSSVFSTTAGGWCLANAGATSCPGQPTLGGMNINYQNWGSSPLVADGVAPKTYHFVVQRYFASGVSALPKTDAPVILAALFSPFDFDENYIGDNVAAGYTNAAPTLVSDAALTTFTTKLGALAENTDSGTLTFDISDADTAETASSTLGATVTLNFDGVGVPVTPNCTLTSAAGTVPVNRQCTFAIPLSDAHWWDNSVGSAYQGLFNTVATDLANGVYAGAVTANAQIVVTDAGGRSSAPVTVPIHVNTLANNPPTVIFGSPWSDLADPLQQGSPVVPTYSCSIGLGANAGGCGAIARGATSLSIDLPLLAQPGPAAAFDELAAQSTAIWGYTDPNGGNVVCSDEQDAAVFVAGAGPLADVVSGAGTATVAYDMNFAVSATAPAAPISAFCTLSKTIRDYATISPPLPNGEPARLTDATFRIVINP